MTEEKKAAQKTETEDELELLISRGFLTRDVTIGSKTYTVKTLSGAEIAEIYVLIQKVMDERKMDRDDITDATFTTLQNMAILSFALIGEDNKPYLGLPPTLLDEPDATKSYLIKYRKIERMAWPLVEKILNTYKDLTTSVIAEVQGDGLKNE